MRDEKCVNRVLLSAGLLMAAGLALQGCGGGGGSGFFPIPAPALLPWRRGKFITRR